MIEYLTGYYITKMYFKFLFFSLSSSQTIMEKKKEKKSKKRTHEVLKNDINDDVLLSTEKKQKKSKKNSDYLDSGKIYNDVSSHSPCSSSRKVQDEMSTDISPKVKKKKSKNICQSPNASTNFEEDNHFSSANVSNISNINAGNVYEVEEGKVKKKKKKSKKEKSKKERSFEEVNNYNNECNRKHNLVETKEADEYVQKKKKRMREDENVENETYENESKPCEISERESDPKKRKKKKKLKKDTSDMTEEYANDDLQMNSLGEDSTCTEKKKKKTLKSEKGIPSNCDSDSFHIINNIKKKVLEEDSFCGKDLERTKKKKKEQTERSENENENSINKGKEELESSTKKKKRKKRKGDNSKLVEEIQSILATPKNVTSNLFKDAVFESEERAEQFSRLTGRTPKTDSEISMSKPFKTKIIDCEPAKSNNNDEKSNESVVEGQWQGMLFENEDRQKKFMRLLGGMKSPNNTNNSIKLERKSLFSKSPASSQKKGLFGSLSVSSTFSENHGGNTALSVSEAANVDKRLEADYDRAMNFRLGGSRGAGLGFAKDPAEGKKFHIDANATKSIQFEDD